MKSKFIDELYLLFIARQGYWNSTSKIDFKEFWRYIYPYFLVSLLLLVSLPFLKEDLITLLKTHFFLNFISYQSIFFGVLYLIIPLGLAYENFYVMKTKTPDTFRLFFNIPNERFSYLLLCKNIILILPVLVTSCFFNPWATIIIFAFTHFLSVKLSKIILDIRISKFGRNSELSYLLSLLDIVSVVKTITIPLFSMGIFMILFVYQPEFLSLQFTTFNQILSASIFLGTVFYSHKGFPYLFLALINDLPYMKAIGINTKYFLQTKIFFLLLMNFVFGIVPLSIFLFYQKFSILQIVYLLLGLLLSYLAIQGFQMREAVFFKDKYIKNAKELEAYKFPIKHYVYTWLSRLLFAGMFLLDQYLSSYFSWFISVIIIVVLLGTFMINNAWTVQQMTSSAD